MTYEEVVHIIRKKLDDWQIPYLSSKDDDFPSPINNGAVSILITTEDDTTPGDYLSGVMTYVIKASASIRIPDGDEKTPDELIAAADEIRRGAQCVKELREMDLFFTIKG